MNLTTRFLACILPLATAGLASAADNQFQLVNLSEDWSFRGFRVGFVNKSGDGKPLPISTLALTMGLGDGKAWRELKPDTKFRTDASYAIKAVISATEARLFVDGKQVAESKGGFVPLDRESGTVAEPNRWFSSRTDYRLVQNDYLLSAGDKGTSESITYAVDGQLALFEFPTARPIKYAIKPGQEVVFEANVSIRSVPASAYVGAVDKYGQATAASWPNKVKSDADIVGSIKDEAEKSKGWAWPSDWDIYGGLKSSGLKGKATGFYRVTKIKDQWWLITPDGNPVFYTGLDTSPATLWEGTPTTGREAMFQELPPKTGITAELWRSVSPWGDGNVESFVPHAWNLTRKFGSDWKAKSESEFARRSRAWGFSGQGKFADNVPGLARIETLKPNKPPKLDRHFDIFDPAIVAGLREEISGLVTPLQDEPRILGFSVGNEYEEIFLTSEIKKILKDSPDSPAAKAMRAAVPMSDPPTEEEVEKARRFHADAYYAFMYKTVKEFAPNHLYFGYWATPDWWQNESDWDMVVPHCDIVGYDWYDPEYKRKGGTTERLIAKFDKPTLVGEFGYAAWYDGKRGFGRYSTFANDEADSGRLYSKYIMDAAADPRCVGATYFQYRDQPVTGRGPGSGYDLVHGESLAHGFVDITDRPKWDLVRAARDTNLKVTRERLKLAK
ncbi:glycosyl hydrolase [bacterium]|nr:MAG: glycosyl hydrolase [bacterium]